jgi:hypothetical protein
LVSLLVLIILERPSFFEQLFYMIIDYAVEYNQIPHETTYETNKNDFEEFGWIDGPLRVFY